MPRATDHSLWTVLHRAWLAAATERPSDPRLAEDAGVPARPAPRILPPLVGAWLH
ncbi:hypothetical protein [Falsiroseomonas sp. HW251]|uniref:hypothetical protein n=1 Tax=Falsiroseomonas sp. HW251 TaxID=3390998 RepID=UPI003D317403